VTRAPAARHSEKPLDIPRLHALHLACVSPHQSRGLPQLIVANDRHPSVGRSLQRRQQTSLVVVELPHLTTRAILSIGAARQPNCDATARCLMHLKDIAIRRCRDHAPTTDARLDDSPCVIAHNFDASRRPPRASRSDVFPVIYATFWIEQRCCRSIRTDDGTWRTTSRGGKSDHRLQLRKETTGADVNRICRNEKRNRRSLVTEGEIPFQVPSLVSKPSILVRLGPFNRRYPQLCVNHLPLIRRRA
jgi:hypothetical protein